MEMPATTEVEVEFTALNRLYSSGNPAEIDPYPMYREMRDTAPILDGDILAKFKVPSQADFMLTGRQVYTLFRYEDVARALQDDDNFSTDFQAKGLGEFLGDGILTAYSGSEHRRLRGAMLQAFTPEALRTWRASLMEPQVRHELQSLHPAGGADLVREFGLNFPINVIYRVLGYPEDPLFRKHFAGWALRILSGTPTDPAAVPAAHAAALAASNALYESTLQIVKERRAHGAEGSDMMARMIHAEYENTRLDDHMIASLLRALLPAAAETTTRSFGNMLLILLDRPYLMERLRTDRKLMTKAINETMRYESTASYLARETRVDMEFHGVRVPAGTALSLCVGSAHHDERVFENPEEVDIDRVMSKPMLGFGSGAHICLGMAVARMEIEVAIGALLDLMPKIRRDPNTERSLIRGLNLRGPDHLFVVWD